MFFKKKSSLQKQTYNKETHRPVLRCSICTGEQVAGFRNLSTGEFEEVMFIRDEKDLAQFKETYDIHEITKEY
jgi:hypothetical protein